MHYHQEIGLQFGLVSLYVYGLSGFHQLCLVYFFKIMLNNSEIYIYFFWFSFSKYPMLKMTCSIQSEYHTDPMIMKTLYRRNIEKKKKRDIGNRKSDS